MSVPIKKVIKLRIKVPANVTVVTELVPVPAELAFTPAKGSDFAAANLEMDLTSAKTSQWLAKGTRIGLTDCMACCVRG